MRLTVGLGAGAVVVAGVGALLVTQRSRPPVERRPPAPRAAGSSQRADLVAPRESAGRPGRQPPPRFLAGPAHSSVFSRPFWQDLTTAPEVDEQLARLAARLDLDAEQKALLEGVFPTLSRVAAAAIEGGDAELAGSVEREARRVLVALSDTDEQSQRVDELFANLTEN
jgi:hypothetical protein